MKITLQPNQAVTALATMAILAVIVSTIMLLWNLRQKELAASAAESGTIAGLLAKQTKHDLDYISLLLGAIQERLQSPHGRRLKLDSPEVFLLLSARAAASEPTSSIFVADETGTIVNTSLGYPPNRLRVADRAYFKALANGAGDDFYIGRPLRNRIDNKWTIYFARRLNYPDGRFRGVVVAAVPPTQFANMFDMFRLDVDREVLLYTTDGILMASLPYDEAAIGQTLSLPAATASRNGFGGHVTTRKLKDTPLEIRIRDNEDSVLASWQETARVIATGAVLVCLLIAAIARFLAKELWKEQLLQHELEEAQERLAHTVESVMDAIVAIDEQLKIIVFNPSAECMFGLPAAKAIGQPLTILMPEPLRARHRQHVLDFLGSTDLDSSRPMASHMEVVGLRANGEQFPIESTISRALFKGRVQMTAVLRDVTERRRAEADLRQANQQLRNLSSSLHKVRESEQTRISRELHDELGQQLTGLKLDLTWLANRIKEGRPVKFEEVDHMRTMLERTIASVRRISAELRPPILDDLGFTSAISWLASEFSKRLDIPVSLEFGREDAVRNPELATTLFRIVQESFTNIARHANASCVEVKLTEADGKITLTVADDGRGIEKPDNGGLGLVSIRERATAMGGELEIISQPGQGTTVKVTIPIMEPATGARA